MWFFWLKISTQKNRKEKEAISGIFSESQRTPALQSILPGVSSRPPPASISIPSTLPAERFSGSLIYCWNLLIRRLFSLEPLNLFSRLDLWMQVSVFLLQTPFSVPVLAWIGLNLLGISCTNVSMSLFRFLFSLEFGRAVVLSCRNEMDLFPRVVLWAENKRGLSGYGKFWFLVWHDSQLIVSLYYCFFNVTVLLLNFVNEDILDRT